MDSTASQTPHGLSTWDRLGRGLTWEEIQVGSVFLTYGRTITETDVVNFVAMMGVREPLFNDVRHLRDGEALFDRRLAPGLLVLGLAEGLVTQTNVIQGTGLAVVHMDVDLLAPSYVGDTIEVEMTVTESRPSSTPGRGVVVTRNRVLKDDGTAVLEYTPVRLVRGADYDGAQATSTTERNGPVRGTGEVRLP